MVSNVNVNSDDIKTATSQLDSQVAIIIPELNNLMASVNGLLGSRDGGLFLTQSSPAFKTAYQSFNTSLVNAVHTISSFSQQFTSIANSIIGMDQAIADSINKK
ncbi:hypothetical protein KGQ20_11745 [Catenulispora sp. NF23]|uniref:Uncharacterized protein n=1 Tax=Catenulispora pinistramenti TaxID=2705254 RepID=A0ABS5L379_9ACTN|nr:hypothetical protein [Catenulispora pinistramenti]MBS2533445.1 hypothetical protein [Catenulispora pinistramenti]MBS2552786.1 hypothetical protein [Catenulispora pinistramenti]